MATRARRSVPLTMLPRWRPMQAARAARPFSRAGWLYEVWWKGRRALAEIGHRQVGLVDEAGHHWEHEYPDVVAALSAIPPLAVLDGIILALDDKGRADTGLLDSRRRHRVVYCAFDCLLLDGEDLTSLPLRERKRRLAGALPQSPDLVYSEHVEDEGEPVFQWVCGKALPGMIAKYGDSAYLPGAISQAWRAIRRTATSCRAEPVKSIPKVSRRRFSARPLAARRIAEVLPLDGYTVPVTHLDTVYFPKTKLSKGEVIDYYRQLAPLLLPILRDRPLELHRHPGGITHSGFVQQGMPPGAAPWVKGVLLHGGGHDEMERHPLCQNEASLVYFANLGTIEQWGWAARVGKLGFPEYGLLALRPQGVPFAKVVAAAGRWRRFLEEWDIPSLCRSDGGGALTLVLPFGARYPHREVIAFLENLTVAARRRLPEAGRAGRGKRVIFDTDANASGAAALLPYSLRALEGAPVVTPLRWSEVTARLDPMAFTLTSLLRRLDREGDIWAEAADQRFDLKRVSERLREHSQVNINERGFRSASSAR